MENPITAGGSVLRNSVILGVFAMVTVGLIAVTQQGTAGRIADEQRRAQMSALVEILPHSEHDNDLLEDTFVVEDQKYLNLPRPSVAYRGRQDGEVVAVILPVIAPDGYSGRIDMMVGIRANGDVAGVRVLSHRETPGLGDKIERAKSEWILSFNGTSLSMPEPDGWAVKKDGGEFDSFTGATITPRAVVQAVYRALQYFEENRAQLLQLEQEPTSGQY
ncbi:electron transport complex protein RnfG [Halopseudomonas xinjiangensis]|uniref:Ion-translocating oxidoreductase complex subunit G n=1 Tax=Halopseudomonas xinjiangensis TaxID=487184 RepID=A0A1H1P3M8_9GAMM|nr:electron transport complex subunit RsxG [Halopseudomonas xinjiangensis]SDS05858.1 electron transport complex protein RnfG [Halopseudomonas xinjiangensis]